MAKEGENMINRRQAFIWITAALILLISKSGAYADHQWGSYHMEKEGPILTVNVGDNQTAPTVSTSVPLEWSSLLSDVVSKWNNFSPEESGIPYLSL